MFCHLLTLIYSAPSLPMMVNHSFPTHSTKLLDARGNPFALHIKSQVCQLFMKMQISQQEKNYRSHLLVYIALCPHNFSLQKRQTYPEFLRELPVQHPKLKVISNTCAHNFMTSLFTDTLDDMKSTDADIF